MSGELMPWDVKDVEDHRLELVEAMLVPGVNVSRLCETQVPPGPKRPAGTFLAKTGGQIELADPRPGYANPVLA